MRPRRLALLLAVGVLGAAAAVLPAVAGSETAPAIEAVNRGGGEYPEYHYWVPSAVKIVPGGSVSVSNPTAVPHGIHWSGGPAVPVCSGTVPVETSGTSWSGTCMFAQPGVYTFYCTVHGPSMAGTITVEAATTSTSSTPAPTPTSTQPTTPASGGSAPGPGPSSPGAADLTSPFAGSHPIGLTAGLHAHAVHGSVGVSKAGAGGRLVVEALVARAALAVARAAAGHIVVGRVVHNHVAAGRVHFTLPLSPRALHALHARGRLTLELRAILTPPGATGASTSVRRVTLHG
jgi:plastocyanin